MIKKLLVLATILLFTLNSIAQKGQKIGYIDMEYILENVPEYTTAQSKLDTKINTWTAKLDKLKSDVTTLKTNLNNEKALLTTDLITEREEDIQIKQDDLKQLQENYFGPAGELFLLRKQIVKPVQDQIYNAVQTIAKNKKYDIILDKSDELIMLYSNTKYDVSELVLNAIVKDRKQKDNKKKKDDRVIANASKKEAVQNKIKERLSKREQMQKKAADARAARIALKDSLRNARNAARLKKLEDIKNKKEALKNKGSKKPNTTTTDKANKTKEEDAKKESGTIVESVKAEKETAVKTKAELRLEKQQMLKDRAAKLKAKRDSAKAISKAKRAKKMAEIEERKKKLKENNNN